MLTVTQQVRDSWILIREVQSPEPGPSPRCCPRGRRRVTGMGMLGPGEGFLEEAMPELSLTGPTVPAGSSVPVTFGSEAVPG